MFSDKIALQIADIAKEAGISETGMLAIVETETAGHPFEADGRTPTFLFERHIFHRELTSRAPQKLASATKAGLAIEKWNPPAQYHDERTSEDRLALLEDAKGIDEECALRACSWGLPQIMGNECNEVGFMNADSMVHFMTDNGVAGHVQLMVKFLKARKLESAIDREDWAYVALRYNGRGYAKNHYDTKLAASSNKWKRRLPQLRADGAADHPEERLTQDEIKHVQLGLRRLGYTEVGMVDGRWGDKTAAAIFAFQKHEGLPPTGHLDDETMKAIGDADPRPISDERESTTLDDLRQQGSRTIAKADVTETVGKVKVGTGVVVGAGTVADATLNGVQDSLDKANDAIEKAHQVKGLWQSIHDLVPLSTEQLAILAVAVVIAVAGYFVIRYAKHIKFARLEDFRTGVHAGIARI